MFPQETITTSENRFALDLSEKEVIELVENAKPWSIKKATNYGMKVFQVKNFKTLFWQFKHPRFSQSKTMQVETVYIFKNFLYIITSGFLSQNKVEKIFLISWGLFL